MRRRDRSSLEAPLGHLLPVVREAIHLGKGARQVCVLDRLDPVAVRVAHPGEQAPIVQAEHPQARFGPELQQSFTCREGIVHDQRDVDEPKSYVTFALGIMLPVGLILPGTSKLPDVILNVNPVLP